MWRSPGHNEGLLKKYGCLENIYKAMQSNDLADVVVAALESINKTGTMPFMKVQKKSESTSTDYRKQGNQAYLSRKYNEALLLYNKALRYAPVQSKALKLALSNRSALFITVKAYSACMGDIDYLMELECPPEIEDKLNQRYTEAQTCMKAEDSYWLNIPKSANTYFKQLYEPRNPQISCATKNVGVIMEDDVPKIVAVNDIKVGTVLAVEPAYVSHLVDENCEIACYYCHRLDYNLVPCDGCCHVMFCNEFCMRVCMNEYHSVECKIMDLFQTIECTDALRLAVKVAIKMRLRSTSWKTLISASKVYGMSRIKSSAISEIYSGEKLFSILTFQDDRNFIHGAMYNNSFILAAIIHYLGMVSGFMPDFSEIVEAKRCLGRIMMYLTLFGTPTLLVNAASINDTPQIEFHNTHNFGFFPLVGKLRNDCMSNCLLVGLNNKVGLVALKPIARGSELTVNYLVHWLDQVTTDGTPVRNRNMFVLYGTVCNCVICSGEWKQRTSPLTTSQKDCYSKIKTREAIDFINLPKMHKNLCRTFALLHDVPFSKEYMNVYKLLRTCIMYMQHVNTENIIMERVMPKCTC